MKKLALLTMLIMTMPLAASAFVCETKEDIVSVISGTPSSDLEGNMIFFTLPENSEKKLFFMIIRDYYYIATRTENDEWCLITKADTAFISEELQ